MDNIELNNSDIVNEGVNITSSNISADEPVILTGSNFLVEDLVEISSSNLSVNEPLVIDNCEFVAESPVDIQEESLDVSEPFEICDPDKRYLRKDAEDTAKELITFDKGLVIGNAGEIVTYDFVMGNEGAGFRLGRYLHTNETVLEVDRLNCRKSGIVTGDNFAQLFAQCVTDQGIASSAWVMAYADENGAGVESVARFKKELLDEDGKLYKSILSEASILQYADAKGASIRSIASFQEQLFNSDGKLKENIISKAGVLQYADAKGASIKMAADFSKQLFDDEGFLKKEIISEASITEIANDKYASITQLASFEEKLFDENGNFLQTNISQATILSYADAKGASTSAIASFKQEIFNEDGTIKDSVISESSVTQHADATGANTVIKTLFGEGDDPERDARIAEIALLANKDYSSITLTADNIVFDANHKISISADAIEINAASVKINGKSSTVGEVLGNGVNGRLETAAGQVLLWTDGILTSAGFIEN